ncbi:hypothetical protein P154DRAFT_535833 [Amniculicola lignicola CBS 123094]|uniref:Peptidase M14 domain-containing protein n=1 Tax=Amniculicola lignicola CBS 123094 TaxID=1392246 RepID=A0A6A5WDS7_9PLEO|nr:hypothetical protein P154DRAFT_535833 [Amniculicola lignicola CBS 123094]
MRFLTLGLALTSLTSAALVQRKVSYDGFKVYRINVGENRDQLAKVVSSLKLATWKGKVATSDVVDLMVGPTQIEAFEKSTVELDTKLMHDDLGLSIAQEQDFPVYAAAAAPNATWFNGYHPIADHIQFLKDLAAAYPNNAEVVVAGKSVEGRDITGIHIWGSGGKGSQKGIVWHGTVHAREWITNMVVEYAAYTLLTSADPTISSFKNKYDFYIFPIVNPDGFAYTQTTDRMWRKNRQTTPSTSCVGRDINRNWPNQWSQRGGASTSPCAEDYKGPSAGDGVETKVLKAQLDSIAADKGVKLYMDIHSYSQLWMYPYGYTCSGTIPEAALYSQLASGAVNAIASVHGTAYTAGPICTTIYQVSGDSVDYAYQVAKAEFSMTVELRDTGRYGFILPAEQIKPTAEEMWAGLAYVLGNMP